MRKLIARFRKWKTGRNTATCLDITSSLCFLAYITARHLKCGFIKKGNNL